MSSITVVTDTYGDRTPLLHESHAEYPRGSEPPDEVEEPPPEVSSDPKQRLVSLDVFRGLTVAVRLL